MLNNSSLGILKDDTYMNLTDEQKGKYIPVLATYASKVRTVPSENVVAWSEVVKSWDGDKGERFISLDDICSKIDVTDNQLHDFLSLLSQMGTSGLDLFDKYQLLPNRDGQLCKKSDLCNGKDITCDLYLLTSPILGTRANVIINPKYADIVSLPLYTRKRFAERFSGCHKRT